METRQYLKLSYRWAFIGAALTALFWTGWHFFVGDVPVITSVKMTPNWTAELPFAFSRWWDISAMMIFGWYAATIRLIFERLKEKNFDGIVAGLVYGLAFGLVFGLAVGLTYGLVYGLAIGPVVGLIYGLAFGLVAWLVFWSAYGLVVGMVVGSAVGSVFGLAVGLAFWLVAGLVYLIRTNWAKKYLWEGE